MTDTHRKDERETAAARLSKRLREALSVASWQRGLPLCTPLRTRLELARTGFKPSSYALYELGAHDPSHYLPDIRYQDTGRINGTLATRLLQDKVAFWLLLGRYLPVPEVLALLDAGRVHPVAPEAPVQNLGTLLARAEAGGVFLKPTTGRKGEGAFELRAGAELLLNGRAVSLQELKETLAGLRDYLVSARVQQAAYAARIFPGAANSLRVITMQKAARGVAPFIPVATHRFGAPGTGPTDNVSRGGLHANVELATGALGAALRPPQNPLGHLVWHPRHPETGGQIEGVVVPHWEAIKRQLLATVARFPALEYVGWDVVVGEDGFWVLEGNASPALAPQMFHPFLQDPRVRAFYEHSGVL